MVGGGHNGLTAAAYLARAGHSVLVLERRTRVGGACTLEQPFPDPAWLVSPCAYSVGLLHPAVVDELGLRDRGYAVQLVDPHMWCPFEDGTSIALWDDPARSAAAVAELAPGDVAGYEAYDALFDRIRTALRQRPARHVGGRRPRPGRDRGAPRPTTPKPSTSSSRRRSRRWSSTTSATSGCARRCTARGSSAPGPGPATPARPASTSCTPRGASKAGPGRGGTWTAAWVRCRSRWPTRRSRRARSSPPG